MTVANRKTVSGFLHVSWRTAGAVARRVAERVKASMPSPFDGLHAIGVDETSHRKGHTYLTVVVDHERHRVTWDHDGYGRDVFGLFFQTLTPEQRASIRVVAGDGARWIDSCVDRWCPNVERVLDGFHIVSWTSGAPDNPRKQQKPQISPIHKQFDKLVEHLLSVTLMHPDDAPRSWSTTTVMYLWPFL